MAWSPMTICHAHEARRSHQEVPSVLGIGGLTLKVSRLLWIGLGTQFAGSNRPQRRPGIPPMLRNHGMLRPSLAPRIRAPDEWTQVIPAARPSFHRISHDHPRTCSS